MRTSKLAQSYQDLRIHFQQTITDPKELEEQLQQLNSDFVIQLAGYRLLA